MDKVTSNTISQFVGKGALIISSLLLLSLLTRNLGDVGFGEYSIVFTWIAVLISLADFGLYMICVRRLSQDDCDRPAVSGNVLGLKIIITLTLSILVLVMIRLTPYNPNTQIALGMALATLLLVSTQDVLKAILQTFFAIHFSVAGEVAGSLVTLGLSYLALQSGHGLLWLVGSNIAGAAVSWITHCFFARKYIPVKPSFSPSIAIPLLKNALPLGMAGLLAVVYFRIDMLMLTLMASCADVGIYGVAYKFIELITLMPTLFLGSIFPLLSHSFGNPGNRKYINKHYRRSFKVLVGLSVPITVGGMLLAKPLALLFVGPDFSALKTVTILGTTFSTDPATMTLYLLLPTAPLIFLGQLNGYLFIAADRQVILLRVYYLLVPANILLNLILIPKYTYLGAAAATLLTEMAAIGYTTYVVVRDLKLIPNLNLFLAPLSASIPMGLLVHELNLHVLILVPLGALCYGLFLSLFPGWSLVKHLRSSGNRRSPSDE